METGITSSTLEMPVMRTIMGAWIITIYGLEQRRDPRHDLRPAAAQHGRRAAVRCDRFWSRLRGRRRTAFSTSAFQHFSPTAADDVESGDVGLKAHLALGRDRVSGGAQEQSDRQRKTSG